MIKNITIAILILILAASAFLHWLCYTSWKMDMEIEGYYKAYCPAAMKEIGKLKADCAKSMYMRDRARRLK